MKNPVYTHVEQIIIPSSHGTKVNYVVCYGYVDWERIGEPKEAIYILMEYGGTISYLTPPHVTTYENEDGTTDFKKVMDQINRLQKKYNL